MTKEEKTMEEQLNEDVLAEQAEAQAEVEAKESKKNQKRWYIVHTYSGYENKVKVNLEKRIEYMNMGDKIFRIEVPQKTVVQMKGGKKQEKEEAARKKLEAMTPEQRAALEEKAKAKAEAKAKRDAAIRAEYEEILAKHQQSL